MDTEARFAAVERHRLALCDQLDGLTGDQWDAASTCAGWRVRDVLGHLVSVQDVPTWKFVVGTFGMRGFHRRVDRIAREFGQRAPADLVAEYRRLAASRRTPPVLGPIAPLSDVVVHALDVERPLGLPTTYEDDAAREVLIALCGGLLGFTSKRLVRGVRFEATDLDFSAGDGPVARGTVADLLLGLNGRSVGTDALEGDGAELLASRLGRRG